MHIPVHSCHLSLRDDETDWQCGDWLCFYLRPLGKCWSILLMEEVEQLVLLVQGHHLTDRLIVFFLLF